MTRLSINLNKVALLRNQRDLSLPSVTEAARSVIAAGAAGVTVHPRPDQRHTHPQDVHDLRDITQQLGVELNVEGNPQPDFLALIMQIKPDQVTLVPDDPTARTSDHGWDLVNQADTLRPIVQSLQNAGMRVSLFVDYDSPIATAAAIGANAIELYTEPYANNYLMGKQAALNMAKTFAEAAQQATQSGLAVHAGHDLNQANLPLLVQHIRQVATLSEISIGHAFTAEALWHGLTETTRRYNDILRS